MAGYAYSYALPQTLSQMMRLGAAQGLASILGNFGKFAVLFDIAASHSNPKRPIT